MYEIYQRDHMYFIFKNNTIIFIKGIFIFSSFEELVVNMHNYETDELVSKPKIKLLSDLFKADTKLYITIDGKENLKELYPEFFI